MSYDLKVLEQGCEELGIALNDTQKQQFIAFYEYLAEKNKVMNLTGITEFQEVPSFFNSGKAFPGQSCLCEGSRYDKSQQNYGYRNRSRISGSTT